VVELGSDVVAVVVAVVTVVAVVAVVEVVAVVVVPSPVTVNETPKLADKPVPDTVTVPV
jgi:hypothetical protein